MFQGLVTSKTSDGWGVGGGGSGGETYCSIFEKTKTLA